VPKLHEIVSRDQGKVSGCIEHLEERPPGKRRKRVSCLSYIAGAKALFDNDFEGSAAEADQDGRGIGRVRKASLRLLLARGRTRADYTATCQEGGLIPQGCLLDCAHSQSSAASFRKTDVESGASSERSRNPSRASFSDKA
jgi:hypothetical protein